MLMHAKSSSCEESRTRRRATFWLCLLSVFAFIPALRNGFVYDDERYILQNPYIVSFSWEDLRFILTQPYFGNFHPLHHLLIATERWIFGYAPAGWHAVSLLLHALNTALLYPLLRRFGVEQSVSFVSACVFALHPVQVESVAWVSEQKNLLSLLFVLLSLRAYLTARETGGRAALGASLALFILALASKVSAVALVPVLLAIEHYSPLPPGPSRSRPLVRTMPFLLLAGAWAQFGLLAHGREGFIHGYPGGSLAATLLTIGPVLVAYGKIVLWPVGLAAAYDLPPAGDMQAAALAAAWLVAGLGALAAFRLAARERDGRIALALIWIGAFLLPVLNLVPIGTLMNDRYLYAPMCAIAPLVVAGLYRLALAAAGNIRAPFMLRAAPVLRIGILALLASLSLARTGVWESDGALWIDAAARSPRSAHALYNLGTYWVEQGRDDLAEPPLRSALEADPRKPEPYQNLGAIHFRQGRFKLAAVEFEAASRLAPENYDVWIWLSSARARSGQTREAIAALRRAAAIDSASGKPYLGLGLLQEELGAPEKAADAFRTFLARGEGTPHQRSIAEERLRDLEERFRNRSASAEAGT